MASHFIPLAYIWNVIFQIGDIALEQRQSVTEAVLADPIDLHVIVTAQNNSPLIDS